MIGAHVIEAMALTLAEPHGQKADAFALEGWRQSARAGVARLTAARERAAALGVRLSTAEGVEAVAEGLCDGMMAYIRGHRLGATVTWARQSELGRQSWREGAREAIAAARLVARSVEPA